MKTQQTTISAVRLVYKTKVKASEFLGNKNPILLFLIIIIDMLICSQKSYLNIDVFIVHLLLYKQWYKCYN